MKKFSIFSCFLATALITSATLLLPGCGKSSKAPDKKGTTQADKKASAKKPASKSSKKGKNSGDSDGQSSVVFYNSFLGFQGTISNGFGKLGDVMEKSEEFVGRPTNKPDWRNVIPPTSKVKKIPTFDYTAPDDFAEKDQEFINSRIEIVKKDVAALIKEVETLESYYKAEDYKDDWHKAFLMAKPRIIALHKSISKNNKEILKLADQLSEETDRKNIAKAPDGVFILNMRYVIDKAKERADLIFDNDFEDTRYGLGVSKEEYAQMVARAAPICDKMDALSKEIDTMCAKYKAADKSVIKGSHAEKIYDEFFASQESSNDDIRRILRDLRQNGYTNAQVTLGGHIGTLVQAHNKFLKSRQEK